MLEQVLAHLKNWFVISKHHGTYSVKDGGISLPFLQCGQYFRVIGSVFNDGLYQYPAHGMVEETFCGSVWALAVPAAVVELSEEISMWDEKNGTVGPYQSESFDGYSYTKATNASGQAITWKDAFRGRLNRWRKL